MGVCFNFLRAGFVHIGYIVYFALIYWRLGLILDNEKIYHKDATIAVGVTLGIILLGVQIGLWIYYFYRYNFSFLLLQGSCIGYPPAAQPHLIAPLVR